MKKNNQGFALAETLIVSTVVAGILIYIFVQFATLKRSFNISFKYNTVNDFYAMEDIADYIYTLEKSEVQGYIIDTIKNKGYFEIKKKNIYEDNVDNDLFESFKSSKGTDLLENLDVQELYITNEDLNGLVIEDLNPKMKKFVEKIVPKRDGNYRLIVRFSDDTFSSISIKLEGVENEQ